MNLSLKVLAAGMLLLMLPVHSWADDPNTKIKVSGAKNVTVLLNEGVLYASPNTFELGKKWDVSEEKNKIYVKLKSGAGRQESVQIPSKIISGKPYVDFGYFAGQSGITYKYDEKHKKITLKKESRDSGKKEEKKSRQVIIWDPEHEFSTSSIKDVGKDNAIIISPTWGSYKDVSQNDFVPDLVYLKGIKDNGFNVLPLIHNDFDIPGTSAFMHDSKMQEKLISRIDAISEVYDLGGYNIDFENMKQEDKNLYTDFIKKLSGAMHEQGKMVTVDVTVYNEWSPTWSLCYDRENLAKAADYLVVMGYDETPGNSTVPDLLHLIHGLMTASRF